jgi:iodotyrosine deiodinase
MTNSPMIRYRPGRHDENAMIRRAEDYYRLMDKRRSLRQFSGDPVPRDLIESAIRTASTAPSGAHRQPWTFVAISDPTVKREIRLAAEEEEQAFYLKGRAAEEWLAAVEPMATNWKKPFLETAPWLVVVFERTFGYDADGNRQKNYYVKESVGIACGFFIAALHNMGLATLTHTPAPMKFLSEILHRPDNERPSIIFPVGYPAENAMVPDLKRRELHDVSVWITDRSVIGEAPRQ